MATIAQIGAVFGGVAGGFERSRQIRLAEQNVRAAAEDRALQNRLRMFGLNLSLEQAKDARQRDAFNMFQGVVDRVRQQQVDRDKIAREAQEATLAHQRELEKIRLRAEQDRLTGSTKEKKITGTTRTAIDTYLKIRAVGLVGARPGKDIEGVGIDNLEEINRGRVNQGLNPIDDAQIRAAIATVNAGLPDPIEWLQPTVEPTTRTEGGFLGIGALGGRQVAGADTLGFRRPPQQRAQPQGQQDLNIGSIAELEAILAGRTDLSDDEKQQKIELARAMGLE